MRRLLILSTIGTALAACGVLWLLVSGAAAEAPVPEARFVLPAAPVRFGAAQPRWTVALLVDLTTAESRQAFSQATRAVDDGLLFEGTAELRLLHAPAADCARQGREFGCAAARAVECAEMLAEGTGMRVAGAAFDLQWERPALAELLAQAQALGVDRERLERCVAEDRAVAARVDEHAAFARSRGLAAAPGGYLLEAGAQERIAPFDARITAETLRSLSSCLARGRCQEAS